MPSQVEWPELQRATGSCVACGRTTVNVYSTPESNGRWFACNDAHVIAYRIKKLVGAEWK